MKTALNNVASSLKKQIQESNQLHFRYLAGIALLLVLSSSCSDDNAPQKDSEAIDTTACKKRASQISSGGDTNDIVYNSQDKPIKITNTKYNVAAPTQPPVITVYTIDYDAQGNAIKVTKSLDGQLVSYYQMDYNSGGKLVKQSEFNALGVLAAYTTVQYDDNGVLAKITTHTEGTSIEVTSAYQYADGTLVRKSIQNLYDTDSEEYYNVDYTYTYFPEKDNKINPYFEGPLGLLFVSNLSNQEALQYLPKQSSSQLFFARETSSEKKMLKNIEIVAYRYATSDTTNLDYSYEYNADGFPTFQRTAFRNVIRRYVPTPFGGSVLLVTPTINAIDGTVNFSCD